MRKIPLMYNYKVTFIKNVSLIDLDLKKLENEHGIYHSYINYKLSFVKEI